MNNHNEIMTKLSKEFNDLSKLIGNENILYLDIPIYGNIGDLLIMLGSIKFFEYYNIRLKSISSAYDFDANSVKATDVIVLQGGGNFGDLYSLHQNFREMIVEKYPSNKIVILPQTIFFEDEENYKKSCEIFKNHKNLHICVRDKKSYGLASNMSENIYLMPDMAHNLYPIKYKQQNCDKDLFIKRLDKELGSFEFDCKNTSDWEVLLGVHNFYIRIFTKTVKIVSKLKLYFLSKLLIKIWISYSKYLAKKAVNLFASYENIYTTRLHGHLLACLMDKKNTVFDNSYGKNSSYIDLWTKDSNKVELKE